MTNQVIALERFARRGLAAQAAVDRALARAELVRRLCAARRTERALRDELLEAEFKVGFAALALNEFDQQARAPYPIREGRAPA